MSVEASLEDGELLSTEQVVALTGLSMRRLHDWRTKGYISAPGGFETSTGWSPTGCTGYRALWTRADVEWIEEKRDAIDHIRQLGFAWNGRPKEHG